MSEHNSEPPATNAEGSTLTKVEQLLAMIRQPIKTTTSADFTATTPQMASKDISSYRTIVAAAAPFSPQSTSVATMSATSESMKRKSDDEGDEGSPKKKKRGPKAKEGSVPKKAKVKFDPKNIPHLPAELWVRIAELCPPKMVMNVRLLNKNINSAIGEWQDQVYIAQIVESYPPGMPTTFGSLTTYQYNNLLGSRKGCLAKGCKNKGAEKTYWPFERRWCFSCWGDKTIKDGEAFKMIRSQLTGTGIPLDTISRMVGALPYGVCDSYIKPHPTLRSPIPIHLNPRLYKIVLKDGVSAMIQSFMENVGPLYQNQDGMTDEEIMNARKARQERLEAYLERLSELETANEKFMEDVLTIERCIQESKQTKKDAMAALRERKQDAYAAKAIAELPGIPLSIIRSLDSYKGNMRVRSEPTIDVKFERSWKTLKPKIEQELVKRGLLDAVSAFSSASFGSGPTSSVSGSSRAASSVPASSRATPSRTYDEDLDSGFQTHDPTPDSIGTSVSQHSFFGNYNNASTIVSQQDVYEPRNWLSATVLGLDYYGHRQSSNSNSTGQIHQPFQARLPTGSVQFFGREHQEPFASSSTQVASRGSNSYIDSNVDSDALPLMQRGEHFRGIDSF